jgi:hypothetical protein
MANIRLIIFLLLPWWAFGQEQFQYERVKVGRFSFELPTAFAQMSDDDIAAKILSYKKPLAFFSDRNKQADLSVNKSNSKFRDTDTEIMRNFYESNVKSVHDNVVFFTNEVQTINGRKYAVLEFEGEVREKGKAAIKKYYYIQYTALKKEVWVFSFSCPIKSKDVWKPVATKAMKSMKVG